MTVKLAVQGLHSWSSLQGYEVLARKIDTAGNVMLPDQFVVPTGDLSWCELDKLVLGMVGTSNFLRNTKVPVFINLSAETMDDENLLVAAAEKLHSLRGWISNDVVLEVSEKYFASEALLIGQVSYLRELGIKVAIDDFGVDYSDTNRLKLTRWDYCKVDLTALKRPGNLDWIFEAYRHCQSLGTQLVLERYEQVRPCEIIKSLKGAWIQGFSMSKPMLIDTQARIGTNEIAI